ncbi:MAG TPA: hypothetical protein VG871_18300 [Vicinamibacterales bacterium]|nr:hypothetical protein [Vicinamibacterales bacterium]
MTTVLANVDRRVLGAFHCVDACTTQHVADPGDVVSDALDLRRNGSGYFVVFNAPGLRDQTAQFYPALPWPSAVAYDVTIVPDLRRYLPRRVQVKVPRIPDAASDTFSSMVAQDVRLYPSPAAPLGLNWAVLRCSVRKAGSAATDPGLPWAVLRLTRKSDGTELTAGVCDQRGEGVLAVPGVRQSESDSGDGAVITATIDVTATAYFDPAHAAPDDAWVPDPDDVLNALTNASLKQASQAAQIGRGTESHLTLSIAL